MLSAGLRVAIDAEAGSLVQVESFLARVDGVANVLAAVENALDGVKAVRLKAIAQLRREGWSYGRIAAASTLSKPRVKQRVVEAEEASHMAALRDRFPRRRTEPQAEE